MNNPIGPVERGAPISADNIDRLAEEIGSRTVSHGKLGMTRQHGSATLLFRKPSGLEPGPRRGGASTATHPFQVIEASAGGTAKVRVVFGQVNNITPTIGGTALDAATAPTLTITTNGTVYLDCTVNNTNGLVTAVSIANAASTPSDTSTHAYKTLATVTQSGGVMTAINQSVTHSLGHRRCGSTHDLWGV